MLSQFIENSIRAVAGMDRNIGVDEIGHDRATPSVPLAHGDFDGFSLFDGWWLGHAA